MDFSVVTSAFEVLRIVPPPKLILLEARTLLSAHVPPYPPDMPVLFTNVDSSEMALQLKTVLLTTYPQEHLVYVVQGGQGKEERLSELVVGEFSTQACLYVPALGEGTSFESFAEIVPICARPMAAPGIVNKLMRP